MQTLYPAAQSKDVAALVQMLIERGFSVPPGTQYVGVYSPALVQAVEDFQSQHGLVVDGIVGPKTWAALASARDTGAAVPPLDITGLAPLIARTLQIADAFCRQPVVEDPAHSNRCPEVDRFLLGVNRDGDWLLNYGGAGRGASWCARFVKFCVDQAAQKIGLASPIAGWGDLASSEKWLARGHVARRVSSTPAPGSVGCILTAGHGHVVLVAAVTPDHLIDTREGNSGDRCAARRRRPEEFAGFVRFTP
jgi:putative peptidoglycan binding protein/CHAP domain-containing protein